MKISFDIADADYAFIVEAFAERAHYKDVINSTDSEGKQISTPNPISKDDNFILALLTHCELVTNDYHRNKTVIPETKLTLNKG